MEEFNKVFNKETIGFQTLARSRRLGAGGWASKTKECSSKGCNKEMICLGTLARSGKLGSGGWAVKKSVVMYSIRER